MKKKRKPPVIRKGQRKPYIKATTQEMEERIEFVARCLVRQLSKMEIHKAIKLKFNIEWRMTDIYIAHARRYLQKQSRMSKEEAKDNGIGVLLDVIRTDPKQRVQAEKRLSEIFGYNAPVKLQPVGEDGIGPAEFIVHVSEKELPKAK